MVPRLCNLESKRESYICHNEGIHCDEGTFVVMNQKGNTDRDMDFSQ